MHDLLDLQEKLDIFAGADDTPDAVFTGRAGVLSGDYRLGHVCSGFQYPPGTSPLHPIRPPRGRVHRPGQADWWLRSQGFQLNEIVTAAALNLDRCFELRLSWALCGRPGKPIATPTS